MAVQLYLLNARGTPATVTLPGSGPAIRLAQKLVLGVGRHVKYLDGRQREK